MSAKGVSSGGHRIDQANEIWRQEDDAIPGRNARHHPATRRKYGRLAALCHFTSEMHQA
jgi:hypothetical protein